MNIPIEILYEALELNRSKIERPDRVNTVLSLIILNYCLIISDSFVLQGWGDGKFSVDSDSQLPVGFPTLTLSSDSQNICINFSHANFSNTPNQ